VTLDIREIDVHDEPALHAWWQVGHDATAERAHDDWPTWPAWEVSRVTLPAHNPEEDVVLLLARDGDETVGAGMVVLPIKANGHLAEVDVEVLPRHRRRGVGTAVLAEVEARARAEGRTTLQGEAFTPASREFAARHGYAVAHTEEMKLRDLEELERRRPALEAVVAAAAGAYQIVDCTDIPDEHLAGFCDVLSSFISQIPLGDLDVGDAPWTPERVREWEQRDHEVGRTSYVALALAPDGTVVGTSDVNFKTADPVQASIGITIVEPGHRGHRLGLALKLATHAALRAAHPECRRVSTSNAPVNAKMNDVNEQLGYRVVESGDELQKVL
jgi:GNAT superfamily N-acetyltransferase